MDSPPTPLHPAPNEEVNAIPEGGLPSGTLANLDLNPDLYDEDTDGNNNNGEESDNIVFKREVDDDHNQETYAIDTLTLSFDQAYELLQIEFDKSTNTERIATYQQSKLINYIDEKLLEIQRKFIKNQADTLQLYSIFQLLYDLSKVFDLIWYSVNNKSGLFGQQDYMIKLMDDLEQYVSHYKSLDDYDSLSTLNIQLLEFFTFFQKLDTRICFLIDGFRLENSEKIERLNNTQIVRLASIISRLRILVISKLDSLRFKLTRTISGFHQEQSEEKKDYEKLRNVLEVEIGRVFEGLLERI